MPSLPGSKPSQTIKYPAGSVVVCLVSFASDQDAIHAGDRVRSDHPEVVRNPHFFHVDGLTTDEIHGLRQARFPSITAS